MSLIQKSHKVSQVIAIRDYKIAFTTLKKLHDEIERKNSENQYDDSFVTMNLGCLQYYLWSESNKQNVLKPSSFKNELEETVQIKQFNLYDEELFDINEIGDLKEHICKFQIALFNLTILYFRNQDYFKCEKLLKLLYDFKDVLDSFICFKVCSLYLELMLILRSIVGLRGTSMDCNAFNAFTSDVLHSMILTASTTTATSTTATSTLPVTATTCSQNQSQNPRDQKNGNSALRDSAAPVPVLIGIKTHQYRSRVMLSRGEVRAARKEIRTVFEQYQSHLRPLFGGATGEDDAYGEDADGIASSDRQPQTSEANNKKGGEEEAIFAYSISSLPAFSASAERKTSISVKANLEFLRGNYKKSLRLLSSLYPSSNPSSSSNSGSSSSSSGSGEDDTEEECKVAYLNNVGGVFAMSGRYAVANLYFQKALKASGGLSQACESSSLGDMEKEQEKDNDNGRNSRGKGKKKQKKKTIGKSYSYDDVHADGYEGAGNINSSSGHDDVKLSVEKYLILYNLGASLLKACKPKEAFHCLVRASDMPLLRRRCQLWIRLAECCVAIACQRSKQTRHHDSHDSRIHEDNHGLRGDCMGQSLQDAVFYLLRALEIVRELQSRDQTTYPLPSFYGSVATVANTGGTGMDDDKMGGGKGTDKDDRNGNYEDGGEDDDGYLDMRDSELSQSAPTSTTTGDVVDVSHSYESMEVHILLKLSYVHLSMNDHSLALYHAKTVLALSMSRIDESTRFLAETYSVEAYCALGQVEAAAAMLDPNSVPSESTLQDCHLDSGFVGDIIPALSVADNTKLGILVNRTAVLILQGQLGDAEALLRESRKLCPEHLPLKRNLVYVLLRRGKTQEALQVMSVGKS